MEAISCIPEESLVTTDLIQTSEPMYRIKGWCEYTLTDDATGVVLREGRSDNVFTTYGMRQLHHQMTFPNYIAISDDERPLGMKRDLTLFKMDGKTPSPTQTPSPTWDSINFIFSRTAMFTSPSSPPRTVHKILAGWHDQASSSLQSMPMAVAYMGISPPISQGSGQSLEIVYRQQFVFPSAKQMRRYGTSVRTAKQCIRALIQVSSNQLYGYTPWQTFGRYYFMDDNARHYFARAGGVNNGVHGSDHTNVVNHQSGDVTNKFGATGRGFVASRYNGVSFLTSVSNNDAKVGTFISAVAAPNASGWEPDDSFSGASYTTPLLGGHPLGTQEGDLSSIFLHPSGESYLYNVVGSVALGQGQLLLKGPYRPDNREIPANKACQVFFEVSGGTDPGTEAEYRIYYGCNRQGDGYMSNKDMYAGGFYLREAFPTSNTTIDPECRHAKTSVCYDGRGHYWMTSRSTNAASGTNRLFGWKGFSIEQVIDRMESDNTRLYGITPGDQLVQHNTDTGMYSPPTLSSNENGLVYYPTRMATAGQQAIYVINNTKPGRYYQRPSGSVSTGSNNFAVSGSDEIHAMWPFVSGSVAADGVTGAGDVGRQIRIVNTTNNGAEVIRTVTAVVDANNVTLDGATFTAESGLTWHWVVVKKRDSVNGLTDRIRVTKYDKTNGRLWAWTDAGIQVSTDHGNTWSSIIANGTGLSTTLAEQCRVPDGRDSNNTCCIGNSGELYWIDTNDGLNKYVGAGPGGTHTRINPIPNIAGKLSVLEFDPVACDIATTEGSLWFGQNYSGADRYFWRLKLSLAFTSGSIESFNNPTNSGVASAMRKGVHNILVAPGGSVNFSNRNGNEGVNWHWYNPNTGTFDYYDYWQSNVDGDVASNGWGVAHVQPDGTTVHFSDVKCRTSAGWMSMWHSWTGTAWVPWAGTGAQFNARYAVSTNGRKKAHTGYQLLRDNIWIAFLQNGSVAQTSEYVTNERFSFVAALGPHRTNIQDLTWYQDATFGAPQYFLEDQPIQTVAGPGGLHVYFEPQVMGNFATLFNKDRALGSSIPEILGNTSRRFGWYPKRTTDTLNGQNGGVVADVTDLTGPDLGGLIAGIDLGSSSLVSKIRLAMHNEQSSVWTSHVHTFDTTQQGRFRVYWSDDNVTFTETPEVAFIAGDGTTPVNTYYKNSYVENNLSYNANGQDHSSNRYRQITFDLEGAGISSGTRTHRYWKVHLYHKAAESNLNNTNFSYGFLYMACFDVSDNAIGIDSALRRPESNNPNFIGGEVRSLSFIQDRVGLSGKTGINSTPDAFADGFTDTVVINTGTFDTGNINTSTDYLAYRHPVTSTFRRNDTGQVGTYHGGAVSESTQVRITSVSTSTITVAKRNIPDSLSNVDWEVRRPALIRNDFAYDVGDVAADQVSGYLSFHDTDVGREFRLIQRYANFLP